jgi:hypothetical protein
MLGRAEELHTLRALITHARNGVGGAVLVQGDPGVTEPAAFPARP